MAKETSSTSSVTGMDTVRQKAKTRRDVKLTKSNVRSRDSLQKIRTLKSIEYEVKEPEQPPMISLDVFAELWGKFQTAIGNR